MRPGWAEVKNSSIWARRKKRRRAQREKGRGAQREKGRGDETGIQWACERRGRRRACERRSAGPSHDPREEQNIETASEPFSSYPKLGAPPFRVVVALVEVGGLKRGHEFGDE